MKTLKKGVSITLHTDTLKEIKNLAEKDKCSLSQYINLVLREHILRNNNR